MTGCIIMQENWYNICMIHDATRCNMLEETACTVFDPFLDNIVINIWTTITDYTDYTMAHAIYTPVESNVRLRRLASLGAIMRWFDVSCVTLQITIRSHTTDARAMRLLELTSHTSSPHLRTSPCLSLSLLYRLINCITPCLRTWSDSSLVSSQLRGLPSESRPILGFSCDTADVRKTAFQNLTHGKKFRGKPIRSDSRRVAPSSASTTQPAALPPTMTREIETPMVKAMLCLFTPHRSVSH